MSDDANEEIPWTLLTRDELRDAYWETVAPAMRDAGLDPEVDRPTHAWLSANGFRGLVYALREYHDRTFGDFWAEDLGLAASERYDWGTDHEETVELLETYLARRRDRGRLSESSAETLRYRLGRYVRAYREANESGDLLTPVARGGSVPAHEATDAAWAAFDRLDDELSPRTTRRIHEAVDDWYAHLVRRKRAGVNPVAGLDDEYWWQRSDDETPANPALDADHVRALSAAAQTPRERLLVVALCAWGLRSGEVAALHRSQVVLDAPTPHLAFEVRKNGPGQVSVLYGQTAVRARLAELEGGDETWNGYFFPSRRGASDHVTRQTVLNWFDALVERAGLPSKIGGQKPVPQMGRRFWYDAYTATQDALLAEVEEIADEQGSASAEVVLTEYLSPERRRTLRREYMREALADAFEDGEVGGNTLE